MYEKKKLIQKQNENRTKSPTSLKEKKEKKKTVYSHDQIDRLQQQREL